MDFDAPLGMGPPPRSRRRFALAAAAGVVVLGTGGVAALLATADPHGGEPFAVASLPPLQPPRRPMPPRSAPVDATPTGSLAAHGPPAAAPSALGMGDGRLVGEGTLENGVRVFRGAVPSGAAAPSAAQGPVVIDVSRSLDGGKRGGHQPATADGGAAAHPPSAEAPAAAPRVAIFIEGMGLSASATQQAIAGMPAAVTLAFLPYGNDVAKTVAAAKSKGHEVLLQLPMENTGGGVPGPHALRPGEPADALRSDLDWLTSRFSGYAGLVNLLGGPVTADSSTMNAVLRAAAARNVFFLDDGTSKRSLVAGLAPQLKVPTLQADVVLDATSDPAVVRANLDQLVAVARRKGSAVGMASGLPEHLGTIARFAARLADQKVTLVPVGTLVGGDTAVATATR